MVEVYFLLACYGLTFAICDASILSRPRDLVRRVKIIDELLSCYFCAGFWVSLGLYLLLFGHTIEVVNYVSVVWVLAHAFAGAAFTFVADVAVDFLEITALERRIRVDDERLRQMAEIESDGE